MKEMDEEDLMGQRGDHMEDFDTLDCNREFTNVFSFNSLIAFYLKLFAQS